MDLKFDTHIKIQKPIEDVFDAVYLPENLSAYFANGGASAPLVEGTTVTWTFADRPDKRPSFPVEVEKVITNRLIRFKWEANDGDFDSKTGSVPDFVGYDNTVEIHFDSLSPEETLVTIHEGGWHNTNTGLKASYRNCMGWSQMLCSLKAYLEYGINLRKGAY